MLSILMQFGLGRGPRRTVQVLLGVAGECAFRWDSVRISTLAIAEVHPIVGDIVDTHHRGAQVRAHLSHEAVKCNGFTDRETANRRDYLRKDLRILVVSDGLNNSTSALFGITGLKYPRTHEDAVHA